MTNQTKTKEKKATLILKTETAITYDVFENILVTALEGGSNFWYTLPEQKLREKLTLTEKGEPLSTRIAKQLFEDSKFELIIGDVESEDEEEDPLGRVTQESMMKALKIASKDYRDVFNNIMTEDYDANDADIVFQLATMGEVVYG